MGTLSTLPITRLKRPSIIPTNTADINSKTHRERYSDLENKRALGRACPFGKRLWLWLTDPQRSTLAEIGRLFATFAMAFSLFNSGSTPQQCKGRADHRAQSVPPERPAQKAVSDRMARSETLAQRVVLDPRVPSETLAQQAVLDRRAPSGRPGQRVPQVQVGPSDPSGTPAQQAVLDRKARSETLAQWAVLDRRASSGIPGQQVPQAQLGPSGPSAMAVRRMGLSARAHDHILKVAPPSPISPARKPSRPSIWRKRSSIVAWIAAIGVDLPPASA
jgi:hypothetical protein